MASPLRRKMTMRKWIGRLIMLPCVPFVMLFFIGAVIKDTSKVEAFLKHNEAFVNKYTKKDK